MTEVALVIVFATSAVLAARVASGRAATGHQAYRLTFPYELTAAEVLAFTRSLGGLLPPWWRRMLSGAPAVTFEVRADRSGISHRLLIPAGAAEYVLSQLWAALPGVRIEADEGPQPDLALTGALELRLAGGEAQLRVDTPETIAAGLLATLQPLRADEAAIVQWIVTPASPPRSALPLTGQLRFLLGARRNGQLSVDFAPASREKLAEPPVLGVCRLGVRATTTARSRQLLRRLLGAMHAGTVPGASFRRRWLPAELVAPRIAHRSVPVLTWPCRLNALELAAFLGIPMRGAQLPGLTLTGSRQLAPAASIPARGRVLGRATFPGSERQLALSARDSLRHLHVIGPTGTGKSTLLANLAAGDMAAGRGVVVVDPKGDLAADVLDRVPPDRVRDVILLDPTDVERPVGFNLLAGSHEAPELVTDHVVSIFRHLYSAFWGPRTDDILRAALLTLAHRPGMTLAEVPLLLSDGGFRRRLLGRLDDPVALEPFWAWYENLSPAERAQAIGPVLNKLRTFLLRRRLRNVIGQADSTFSMEAVLAERRILLVSLAKGVLGEDAAALLGSAVLARLWQAVQARAALPHTDRTPVFCHIDEFQDYLNLPTSLADVLAQARGYGFGLTLAHQHLGQLPPALRQAVLANARTRVVFQTAASDATMLAREFAPHLAAHDLQGLGPFEAVAAVTSGNRVSPPASMVTLPATEPTGQAGTARALSRQRNGRPVAEVERAMRERIEGRPAPAPVGARRRR